MWKFGDSVPLGKFVKAGALKNLKPNLRLMRGPLGAKADCIKIKLFIHLSMLNLKTIKETLHAHKQRLTIKYGLSKLAIFGSYARNQQTVDSDLDILVEFDRPIGSEFIDLADELEQLLRVKIDLVSKKGIKEKYLKSIEKELDYV